MRGRSIIIVRNYPEGPRCWILGQRVHHGLTGLVIAVALRRHRRLVLLGLALCAHDRHDWRRWVAREKAGQALDRSAAAD